MSQPALSPSPSWSKKGQKMSPRPYTDGVPLVVQKIKGHPGMVKVVGVQLPGVEEVTPVVLIAGFDYMLCQVSEGSAPSWEVRRRRSSRRV